MTVHRQQGHNTTNLDNKRIADSYHNILGA